MRFVPDIRGRAEVLGIFGRPFEGEELLRQLLFLLFQLGQFLVEVEVVEIQVVVNPQGIAGGLSGRGDGRRFGRRRARGRCGRWRRSRHRRQVLPLLQQLLRRIEHVQAGSAAHCAMGGTQLRKVYAEAGATVGALGDEAFGHAAIRRSGETRQLV
ncbi:hypothetical protein D9M68_637570 [compost metagenome]